MAEPLIRAATGEDQDAVLSLMQAYYAEDDYPFHEGRARAALANLIADASLGKVWVIAFEGDIVGYVVLTLGFSLEYLGRDAFVDELYLSPSWRGRGLGREALKRVEDACRELGVNALHLEVERDKRHAKGLYESFGFCDNERSLLTRWLKPPTNKR